MIKPAFLSGGWLFLLVKGVFYKANLEEGEEVLNKIINLK